MRSSRVSSVYLTILIPHDRHQVVQPLAHGLFQVVTRWPNAALRRAMKSLCLPHARPHVAVARGLITLAFTALISRSSWRVRVGAYRLFDRASGSGAIEARQIFLVCQRTQPLDFLRNLPVIVRSGIVGRVETDRLGIILQRTAAIALLSPRRTAVVPGALIFRIQFQRRIVVRDGTIVVALRLVGVAAVGQKFRLGTKLDRFIIIGDRTRVVAIAGELQPSIIEKFRPGRVDSWIAAVSSWSARSLRPSLR